MLNRIRQMRMRAGFSCAELARRLDMIPATLGRIERGERGLRTELAVKIADVCSCRLEEVVGVLETTELVPDDTANRLPIVGRTLFGTGVAMTQTGATIPRPSVVAGVEDAYGFDMPDATMSPRYEPGEVLIVDPSRRAKPGDYVIAGTLVDGQELGTAYRLEKLDDFGVALETLNPQETTRKPLKEITRLHVIVGSLIGR